MNKSLIPLLGLCLALANGCSSTEYVEPPAAAELSKEVRSYLKDFIDMARNNNGKSSVTEAQAVIESLQGYRAAVGDTLQPTIETAAAYKDALSASASKQDLIALLDKLERQIEQI